jgi:hypothetical protein
MKPLQTLSTKTDYTFAVNNTDVGEQTVSLCQKIIKPEVRRKLTLTEMELLKLIKNLQDRCDKLEEAHKAAEGYNLGPETEVLMQDGSLRKVRDIIPGNLVTKSDEEPPAQDVKLNQHLTLSEEHSESECDTNWWLYDDRAYGSGMNIGIRAETRDEAFVETIEFWAERALAAESAYSSIKVRIDEFVGKFTNTQNE